MDLISTYANGVSELTNFSQSVERAPLMVDVIVNPHAGFFKRRATVWKHVQELELKLTELRRRYPRRKVEIHTVHFTERPGHARTITEQILQEEEKTQSGLEHLLIGCGGDGTSNEICTALVQADRSLLDRLKLLRLPLGTGNDMADAATFTEAYDLILGSQQAVATGALVIRTASGAEHYAFNIASVGLDAYIADLTNRFKRVIPGDAYKSLVDLGSLFYDQRVKLQPMDLVLHSPAGESKLEAFLPSMVIVGVSGQRTYGGHIPALPGPQNVCVVGHMSVLKKVRSKKVLYEGRHKELAEVSFHDAESVEIRYPSRIPMQVDGEVSWLGRQDFPVRMRVLDPKIKVLRN